MTRPYIPIGCDQQGHLTPTELAAFDPRIEPWHLPHFATHIGMQQLDAQQLELVTAGVPLPELLLKTGAMSGPFKRTRPVTRWRLACRRFTRALLAFLVAPRPYL